MSTFNKNFKVTTHELWSNESNGPLWDQGKWGACKPSSRPDAWASDKKGNEPYW